MVGEVVRRSVAECGLPEGTFSLLQGMGVEVGASLVQHPSTKAVGFTGSLAGGRALFDLAASRPEPIPVFAEMGSTNPVFLLPGALAGDGASRVAAGLGQSVAMGVGQFCTNPGLVVVTRSTEAATFLAKLAEVIAETPAGTMLHAGIRSGYETGVSRFGGIAGVNTMVLPARGSNDGRCQVHAGLFATDATTWLSNPELGDEVFGPCTMVIECADADEMRLVAENLRGQLTASLHGVPEELVDARDLLRVLERVAGRVIVNGFPTGVEVCHSMQHGGPYPATTDSRTTSVGASAIQRFVRPVAYQDMPAELLPEELRDDNPLGILRLVDGDWTREAQA
jgi:NADP-dependent aldehyde dehydrogenase